MAVDQDGVVYWPRRQWGTGPWELAPGSVLLGAYADEGANWSADDLERALAERAPDEAQR
jgi:hypothetical protein